MRSSSSCWIAVLTCARGEQNNQTGLHWAVIGRQLDTVKLLLKRGAPLEAKERVRRDGRSVRQTWCVINGDRSADYIPIITAFARCRCES